MAPVFRGIASAATESAAIASSETATAPVQDRLAFEGRQHILLVFFERVFFVSTHEIDIELGHAGAREDAKFFDVGNDVVRGVFGQVRGRIARMRAAASTGSLIEKDDAVASGIKEPSMPGCATGAWATVKDDRGLSGRIATNLPVEEVTCDSAQSALPVRLLLWFQLVLGSRLTS